MTRLGLILVGAGSSRRMGKIDKIWEPLGNHPVVWYSVFRLGTHAERCVLVVRSDDRERATALATGTDVTVTAGGAERQDSVACGMLALGNVDLIAIHDVARPFASPRLLREGVSLLDRFDGVVPVIPVLDTLKEITAEGTISRTVDRSVLRAVQTPQVFHAAALREAHRRAGAEHRHGTDDAQLLELAGFTTGVIPGTSWNLKITTPEDLSTARALLAAGLAL